jgi:dolichol-phosphate mannosyltransferase
VVPEISIVVPVHNEEENIVPLARELAAAMQNVPRTYEVVFVDDGSTDRTWQRVAEVHRADRRMRGVRHQQQAGQSAAFWTGLRATTSPVIATLDGDLQNDPADLPKLLAELDKFDFVCGVRVTRQDGFIRRASSRIARWARHWVLGIDFRDTGCGFRVFKRAALDGVFAFDGLHRFLPILVQGTGATTREIPINHRPRRSGRSKYGVWNRLGRGIFDLFAMSWYQRRRGRPVPIEVIGDANEQT